MRALNLVRLRRRLVASAMGAGLMVAMAAGLAAHPVAHYAGPDQAVVVVDRNSNSAYTTDEISWN